VTNSLEPSPFAHEPSIPRSSWRWRFQDSSGAEVGSSFGTPTFPSQGDAESWLGEVWRDLADESVGQVTLLEGDREVYGPMSLAP
jgi:hypothetical protein